MEISIEPPVERVVTLTMTETQARCLLEFASRIDHTRVRSLFNEQGADHDLVNWFREQTTNPLYNALIKAFPGRDNGTISLAQLKVGK